MDRPKIVSSDIVGVNTKIRMVNRNKIIDAAEQEFMQYGFKGSSIARIAEIAMLPRTNIHYYFSNKLELYGAVLSNIIKLWNSAFSSISADDDPKKAISDYIDAKMEYSRTNARASVIFASEIIHGAPYLSAYLNTDFKTWIGEKSNVIQSWIEQGKMDKISPYHLLFMIWGSTQHYANFAVEIEAALDKKLTKDDFLEAQETIKHVILKGCGL